MYLRMKQAVEYWIESNERFSFALSKYDLKRDDTYLVLIKNSFMMNIRGWSEIVCKDMKMVMVFIDFIVRR